MRKIIVALSLGVSAGFIAYYSGASNQAQAFHFGALIMLLTAVAFLLRLKAGGKIALSLVIGLGVALASYVLGFAESALIGVSAATGSALSHFLPKKSVIQQTGNAKRKLG